MSREARWSFGSPWVDSVLPVAIGVLCALIVIRQAGPFWSFLVVPAMCWCVWQLARWREGRLIFRVVLVTFLAIAIFLYVFFFLRVDTAKLHQAVADAGIGVNTVTSDRNRIVISIQPVSWGSERNIALRAIFAAVHTHARSKKSVSIQWGDAMTTTVRMTDVAELISGHITYREMLNRMDWSGTPEILPEDSTSSYDPWLLPNTSAPRFSDD